LLAYIGWANKLKNDSFPDSTFWSLPNLSFGGGMTFALKAYMLEDILIPN